MGHAEPYESLEKNKVSEVVSVVESGAQNGDNSL
jgi:hypothetical protein